MTNTEQRAAAFWEGKQFKSIYHPYTIMFQVEDNYPVYMHDYREWVEYLVESYPSNIHTVFVTEKQMNIQHILVLAKFQDIYDSTMEVIRQQAKWLEHNGVTTA